MGNAENWRYQAEPGISATQLRRLDMFGQHTIVGDRVFIGGQNGHV